MNLYRTLNGEVFDLDKLPAKQKSIYAELKSFYDVNVEWTKFTNLWVAKVREVFGAKEPSEIVEKPIYKICQDLDSRLGIRQGYTREPNYQDLLADIINIHFGSRYQFCKQTGVDEGYLSSILNRKKNPSLKMLQGILEKINYRIRFVEQVTEPRSHNEASSLSAEALKTRNSSGSGLNWSMTDDAKRIILNPASGATDRGTDDTASWMNISGMYHSGCITAIAISVSKVLNMSQDVMPDLLLRKLCKPKRKEVTASGR